MLTVISKSDSGVSLCLSGLNICEAGVSSVTVDGVRPAASQERWRHLLHLLHLLLLLVMLLVHVVVRPDTLRVLLPNYGRSASRPVNTNIS